MSGAWLDREIREQPGALARTLAAARPIASEVAAELERRPAPFALIAARGSSDNAARYAQYLLGAEVGMPVALAAPSLSDPDAGARPLSLDDALVVAISQSGRSPDVVGVLRAGGGRAGRTLAITNDPASPLAAEARWVLDLDAGEERSVAATKTVTCSFAALAELAAALPGSSLASGGIDRLPDWVEATLEGALGDVPSFDPLMDARHVVVLGRGVHLATATETALKVRELTGVVGEAFSPPDLLHGPIAAVGKATVALAVDPGEPSTADALAQAIERGARPGVLAPAGARPQAASGTPSLAWPAAIPPALAPIPATVAGQVLARAWAAHTGADLDSPHGLTKVTLTR